MKLTGGIASHVGNVRSVNQDRAYFGGCLAAVADGMGGHQGGEIAAEVAVSRFDGIDGSIECDQLLGLVSDANSAVFEKAIDPDLRGMGTTLVVLALQPESDQITIANVGDSRAYQLRDGSLRQVTVDHSLVQDLVTAGKITEEEAQVHPQRNIVTRALGISPTVEPDSFTLPVQVGDRYLLCSDGLINEVEEPAIAEMLQAEDATYVANKLVQAAINEAGRDNVTVAVVDIVEGEPDEAAVVEAATITADVLEPEEDPTVPMGDAELGTDTDVTAPMDVETLDEEVTAPIEDVSLDHEATAELASTEDALGAEASGAAPIVDHDFGQTETEKMDTGFSPVVEQSKKKSKAGLLLVPLFLAAAAGAAYFGVNWYGTNAWFVGEDSGKVAIFRGYPDGFLWVQPTSEETIDDLNIADLDKASKEELDRHTVVETRDEAEQAARALQLTPEEPPAEKPAPPDTTLPPEETIPEIEIPNDVNDAGEAEEVDAGDAAQDPTP